MELPEAKALIKSKPENPDARVTVVLCCYSHESYFLAAAQSILAQTTPIEFLILNNGANASYTALIERYAERNNLKVIDVHPNSYGVAIRTKVIPEVETEYLAILHDDDVYHPDKIERSLIALDDNGADYILTNSEYIDERGAPWMGVNGAVNAAPFTGRETRGRLIADMIRPPGCAVHYSTLVMKTTLAKHSLIGDPFWPRIADAIFWVSLFLDVSLKYAILTEPLTKIRIHGANDRLYEKFKVYERNKQFFLLSMSEVQLIQRVLDRASDDILLNFLSEFTGVDLGDDVVEALCLASVILDQNARRYWTSKQYMIPLLVHKAFAIAPLRACEIVEELSGRNANSFMDNSYQRYAQSMLESFAGVASSALDLSTEMPSNEKKNYRDAEATPRWIWRQPRKALARGVDRLARAIGAAKPAGSR